MKLLFCYLSEKVYEDNDANLYVSGNFTSEVWERYLNLTDELHVLMTLMPNEICDGTNQKNFQKIDNKDIHIHLVPNNTDSVGKYFSASFSRKRKAIIEEAIKVVDVVIIRSANKTLINLCKKYNKPYAIEVVGCVFDALWYHSIPGKILAIPSFIEIKKIVADAPYVLYVTNSFLQNKYPTAGKTTNCSNVSLNMFDEKVLHERIEKIATSESKFVIGTAAALHVKYKGQKHVIKALATLKKQGKSNFEYQLVGGGNPQYLLNMAKKYGVEEHVVIRGRLSHDDVMEWMKKIDLYVQPSDTEGLPRAVIEAMSMGVPCIGSNVGGIPELIRKPYLFAKRDSKGIAEILSNISKEDLCNMAKENFAIAQHYDVNVLKQRRHEFYLGFLEESYYKEIG